MTNQIIWINHAGYELRIGGIRIVHDPWIDGLAFDNGWSLISPSVYKPDGELVRVGDALGGMSAPASAQSEWD